MWWQEHLATVSTMSNAKKATYVKALFRNKRSEEPTIRLEMQLYCLNLEFLQWIDDVEHDSNLVRDRYTVSIVRSVKDICDGKQLTPSALKILKSALEAIGLSEYVPALVEKSDVAQDKRLSFKPMKLISSKTKEPYFPYMRMREHPVIWQLRVFGEFMDRSMDGLPDSRVSFVPDAWQREVLDNIDATCSLLVVGQSHLAPRR